jgi:hypothetical protein
MANYLITWGSEEVEHVDWLKTPAEVVAYAVASVCPRLARSWPFSSPFCEHFDLAIWDNPRLVGVIRDGTGPSPHVALFDDGMS